MEYQFNSETIERMGVTVRIDYFYDSDRGYPWDECDGHGPVRKSRNTHWHRETDKRPGEVPLNKPDHNEYQFYYDWQQAMKIAKRDGWNTAPYDAPNRVLRAVQADFNFIRGFLNDQWHYAGIVCTVLDSDGDGTEETDSCWGFETLNNYHETSGHEMAESLAESVYEAKLNSWRAALHEARNRKYWASRDVVTVGVTL